MPDPKIAAYATGETSLACRNGISSKEGREVFWQRSVWGLSRATPRKAAFPQFLFEVGKDGFLTFGGSRYGVPWAFAGRTVEVRENGCHIEVYSRIAVHPKAVRRRGLVSPLWKALGAVREGGRLWEGVSGWDVDPLPVRWLSTACPSSELESPASDARACRNP